METISMQDLYKKLGKLEKGEVILDIRTAEEYAEGHVPGSINITHTELLNHLDEIKKYKKIYMHCRSGGRVKMSLPGLTAAGINNIVSIVNGGMMEWSAAGYPEER